MKYTAILISIILFSICCSSIAQNCEDIIITHNIDIVLPRCGVDDGEIVVLSSSGGIAPYRYELNGVNSSVGFFDLPLGVYQLVTTDGRLCKDTTNIELLYKPLEELIKPDNTFTPNGDNINDIWRISGINRFQAAQVRVFNRWGQLVHVNSPYNNLLGWDGTQNGAEVTEGTYYYVISVIDNCVEDHISGSVTIVR